MAFFGEGTASSNDFHAALNYSGVFQLPVIFFLRNNGYAISTSAKVQTAAKSLAVRAEGYGIHGIQINGNDIFCVVKAVREAVERARSGKGPTLIEANTYRLGAHSSSDDPTRYRTEDELKKEQEKDGLLLLQKHAIWRKVITAKKCEALRKAFDQEIEALIEKNESLAPPSVDSLFNHVYGSLPDHLLKQKNSLLDFKKRESHGSESES